MKRSNLRCVGDNTSRSQRPLVDRLAGAPISWGICEVPGWGKQLGVDRVLSEMRSLGLRATELGASGWLPGDADAINEIMKRHDLQAMAAFVPLALQNAARAEEMMASAVQNARLLQAVGAECFVTCPVSDPDDWQRPQLSADEWRQLEHGLGEVDKIAADHGLLQVLHPHANCLVEQADEVQRMVDNTAVQFCLDTGHLTLGHADPLEFARKHADRVGIVHLKDVRVAVARKWESHELTLMGAVQEGMFACLGQGDVAIDRVINELERVGYDGWYVFEQDLAITGAEPDPGTGPIDDVRTSVDYVLQLAGAGA
jgi:inosose dehydratase